MQTLKIYSHGANQYGARFSTKLANGTYIPFRTNIVELSKVFDITSDKKGYYVVTANDIWVDKRNLEKPIARAKGLVSIVKQENITTDPAFKLETITGNGTKFSTGVIIDDTISNDDLPF